MSTPPKRLTAKRISQAELDVLTVLWTQSPLAASDVIARLDPDKDWTDRTVKTLLARLVEKGAVETQPDGRRYLYTPILDQADYAGGAATKLINKLFGGRASALVAHLAESKGLSDEDIAELESLIKDLKS